MPSFTNTREEGLETLIVKWLKDHNGYEVELSNGMVIEFNRNFQVIDVDNDD